MPPVTGASNRRRLPICHLLPILLLSCLLWSFAGAQTAPVIPDRDRIPLPDDFSQVHFYLITVDVGNQVWDNFGHTALRVVDDSSGTDLLFNWGLFDTSVGVLRFGVNFMRGIMEYQLGVAPSDWELGRYEHEQRSVWQDRINLTDAQKRTLYQRLSWNLREENIVYDYDYFFDNCTTRVRDYLDEAMGGAIAEQNRHFVPRTFRDEVVSHYESLPVIALSLDVLMNSNIDQRMTQWQQMFLPLALREQLRSTPSDVTIGGQRLNVLSDAQLLVQFPSPEKQPSAYYFAGGLMLPVLLLLLLIRRVSIASFGAVPGFTLAGPALSYRLLGLLTLVIALFSGIYGIIMTAGWLFSAHVDLHANINLLLFWPTDIIGVWFAAHWIVRGRSYAMGTGKHQLISLYLWAHVLAALVYLVMGLFGLTDQRTGNLMLFVVPLLLLFTTLVAIAGLRPVRGIRFG